MTEMLYTVAEAAEILKAGKAYVYKLINAGQLKVIKLPNTKIRKSELERFLEQFEGYDLTDPEQPKVIDLANV